MNLVDSEIFRLERFEKVHILGSPRCRWERHAQALVDAIAVAQP
jgi:hypothetical protein